MASEKRIEQIQQRIDELRRQCHKLGREAKEKLSLQRQCLMVLAEWRRLLDEYRQRKSDRDDT